MPKPHFHVSIEQGAIAFLYWIAFYNMWRIIAAFFARRSGVVGNVGAAMGGLVHSAPAIAA